MRLLLGFADKIAIRIDEKKAWKTPQWVLLLHDNAPAHRAQQAVQTAEQCGFEILQHPAYSPDLAPSNFFLFPNVKKSFKGRRFHDNEDAIEAVEDWLGAHSGSFFSQGLLKVKERWQKCVTLHGDYVKK